MTTILYRGNFQPEREEPWSTEWQLAATLEEMGHSVIRAQEVGKRAVGWDWVERTADEYRPDLFLWTQTGDIDPDGAYRTLVALGRLGIPSASYHLDLFWGINRQHQLYEQPFWRTDFVFTADGGHPDQFARARINHHWAEPATYEGNAVVGHHRPEYAWPLVFTGSHPYPHEEHRNTRTYMIDWLKQRYGGRRFRVYTGGIRNRDHADLCASATIVIGDSCLAGKLDRYWSERIPETLGRAGFLIHPYCPGLEDSYRDGAHLRWYDAGDMLQLTALVDHYLAHPEEAARIAAAGRGHVHDRHLYRHRLGRLLETVGATERSLT